MILAVCQFFRVVQYPRSGVFIVAVFLRQCFEELMQTTNILPANDGFILRNSIE
jgi:hypothetical protein